MTKLWLSRWFLAPNPSLERTSTVDQSVIRAKFGDDYVATEKTYRLGIDVRLTTAIAERFTGLRVLETCTGAGFTTLALAKVAAHVTSIEIDPEHQSLARKNINYALTGQ